jgi:tetratricopeptide (TPR) repeat protein
MAVVGRVSAAPRKRTNTSLCGSRSCRRSLVWAAILWGLFTPTLASAADLAEAEALYRSGKYAECAELAGAEIEARSWREPWRHWKIQAEMAQGKYPEALASLEEAIGKFPSSVPLNLLARDVYLYNDRAPDAVAALEAIDELVIRAPGRFSNAESRVALGRYFLIRAADAKKVLEQFFDFARNQRPEYIEGWLASAELALEKNDDQLAADTLKKAPDEAAADPRFHYLLARAFANSDSEQAEKALAEALRLNPRHVDSLLLQVDALVDGEQYDEAKKTLEQIFAVNPNEPRAWAYEAALAHLRNDPAAETAARDKGLAFWKQNPEVDYIIGRKLSQKYRFAEGSAYQRRALAMDPYFMAAKVQLSQDLLRLGEEEEGWKLAREVFAIDGYNVATFNLITLHDHLAGFRTLTADGFVLRMDAREAELYGRRALDLLGRAKQELCEKYDVEAPDPVLVEIFPQQKDFAVRTFGMPGVDGFLGVCFGKVITANSPASQGDSPSNWEAVLWHEFCHVVTLAKTKNKMPRWLSEGISVYEETHKNPGWGQAINVTYREMLLDEKLTPLSELSSAFLTPKSALDLQFAYFESYLAVKYLLEKHGQAALNGALDDLGAGLQINDALARHTQTSLEQLDVEFADYAREFAEKVAPDATWEKPDFAPTATPGEMLAWAEAHPENVPALLRVSAELVRLKQWNEAKPRLEKLRALFPELIGDSSAYAMLAVVHRELGETEAEQAVLEDWASRDGDALPAYLRLIELAEARGDWEAAMKNARRAAAVNPLTANVHRALARAAEATGDRAEAIEAYRALVLLDTTDPAEQHFRLARLLKDDGQLDAARREALKSLEEAPRYRAAHALLLELTKEPEGATP